MSSLSQQIKSSSATATLAQSLNHTLAQGIALKLQAKQAHWNIRGNNFVMWHELLDQIAATADTISDSVAERNVQTGGIALGLAQHLPKPTGEDISGTHAIPAHIKAVLKSLHALANALKALIHDAEEINDAVTADLATSSLADLDKHIWFVSAHEIA